jgi:hypothetical protein
MILSKQQILDADDRKRETVSVPEWGGEVIVATMSGTDRDAWEGAMVGRGRDELLHNARAKLAAICLIDESGARLFSDQEVEALGRKSARALNRVADVAQRLNGLRDKDIEELKGN